MEQWRAAFFVEDPSGAELKYDLELRALTYITRQGDVGVRNEDDLSDLLISDKIVYYHLTGRCILMIGNGGEEIICFDWTHPRFDRVSRITRTELDEEGFDYNLWLAHPAGPIFCYEMGICRFDNQGAMIWTTEFDAFRLEPDLERDQLKYREDDETVVYALGDGTVSPVSAKI